MVDKEMLMAMEELLDKKLNPLYECTFRLETSMKELKTTVKKLDERVSGLETTVKKLDERVSGLEISVKKLDEQMSGLETSVKKLEAGVKEIKVDKLENNVIPRLSTIERCYLDTYRRYVQNNELIEKMVIEVDTLVKTVQGHSVLLHAT